jgi:hypothetical protein
MKTRLHTNNELLFVLCLHCFYFYFWSLSSIHKNIEVIFHLNLKYEVVLHSERYIGVFHWNKTLRLSSISHFHKHISSSWIKIRFHTTTKSRLSSIFHLVDLKQSCIPKLAFLGFRLHCLFFNFGDCLPFTRFYSIKK